jgi:molybdopterin converting factor small subunit
VPIVVSVKLVTPWNEPAEDIELEDGSSLADAILKFLQLRKRKAHSELEKSLLEPEPDVLLKTSAVTVNKTMCDSKADLASVGIKQGDQIALVPPVLGG